MTGLRDQLAAIYDRHGTLTPGLVVEEARPKTSPLHDRFEWNDKVAGAQYRLVQARELIRSCSITYRETDNGDQLTTRAFVATYAPGESGSQGYVPTDKAMADPLTSQVVLRAFERQLKALRRQYSHLSEFRELVAQELLDEAGVAS